MGLVRVTIEDGPSDITFQDLLGAVVEAAGGSRTDCMAYTRGAGWVKAYQACEKQAKNVITLRRALDGHVERLTALLLQLRHGVEQYNELHAEQVDADQLVAAIIDSMSDRDQEGVTPDALSTDAQP